MTLARSAAHALLERCFRAALDAVHAGRATQRALAAERPPAGGTVHLVAAGKAAASMAQAAERALSGRLCDGIAVTKDGHGLPLEQVELREAAHPIPDARSEAAALAILEYVASIGADGVLYVLLSGGASSLWTAPVAADISLAAVASGTDLLLRSGAPIEELNAFRKHVCALAGGRLAGATRAGEIRVLAVSDVPGDDLAVIASGPCAADPSRYRDVLESCDARGVLPRLDGALRAFLERGAGGRVPETPKPGDARFDRVRARVIACNRDARSATLARAREFGLEVVDLGECLRGEAREAARRLISTARDRAGSNPTLCVAGGETVVTVRGSGRGGRSQELALAAALELSGSGDVALLAAGTDGTDGPTDAAGAWADGGTVLRGAAAGADAAGQLAANDSYAFFRREGGLLRTGPTHTNVMDLVMLLVGADRIESGRDASRPPRVESSGIPSGEP